MADTNKIYIHQDHNKQEIRNFAVEQLLAHPTGAGLYEGRIWQLTSGSKFMYIYTNGATRKLVTSEELNKFGALIGPLDVTGGIPDGTTPGQIGTGVDSENNPLPAPANIQKGDFWIVSVAGTIVGLDGEDTLEIGDILLATADGAAVASSFIGMKTSISPTLYNSDGSLTGSRTVSGGASREAMTFNELSGFTTSIKAVGVSGVETNFTVGQGFVTFIKDNSPADGASLEINLSSPSNPYIEVSTNTGGASAQISQLAFPNATGARTWTLQDGSGTLAFLSDIPAAQSLSDTLTVGSTTLDGQSISALNGGGELDLRNGGNGTIFLGNNKASWHEALYMTDGYIELSSYQNASAVVSLWTDNTSLEIDEGNNRLNYAGSSNSMRVSDDYIWMAHGGYSPFYSKNAAGAIIGRHTFLATNNSAFTTTTDAIDQYPAIISSRKTGVNVGVTNSVALGGVGMNMKTDDSAYVNQIAFTRTLLEAFPSDYEVIVRSPIATADRVQLIQDADGTIALLSDIPAAATTIYSGDGALAGNRTITTNANTLTFASAVGTGFILDPTNSTFSSYTPLLGSPQGTLQMGSITATRTWTMPDNTGTVALLSDIPAADGSIYANDGTIGAGRVASLTDSLTFDNGSSNNILEIDSSKTILGPIRTNTATMTSGSGDKVIAYVTPSSGSLTITNAEPDGTTPNTTAQNMSLNFTTRNSVGSVVKVQGMFVRNRNVTAGSEYGVMVIGNAIHTENPGNNGRTVISSRDRHTFGAATSVLQVENRENNTTTTFQVDQFSQNTGISLGVRSGSAGTAANVWNWRLLNNHEFTHNFGQLTTGDFIIRGLTDQNLFRADASVNRVGFGLSNPSSKVHIVANGATVGTYSLIVRDSLNTTNRLAIRDDGFVALRQGTPTGLNENIRLEGQTFISNGGLLIASSNTFANTYADLNSSLGVSGAVFGFNAGANTNNVNFKIFNDIDTNLFVVTTDGGDGRIGINQASPNTTSRLHVTGKTVLENVGGNAALDVDGLHYHRGPAASLTLSPHTNVYHDGQTQPVFQQLNWGSDNISLGFGTYYDGLPWKSSDTGSAFQIYKVSDALRFNYGGGAALGTDAGMTGGFALTNAGRFKLGNVPAIGVLTTPSAKLHITGEGNTAGTTNFLSESLAGTELFRIYDDGQVTSRYGYQLNDILYIHSTLDGDEGNTAGQNTLIGRGTPIGLTSGGSNGTANTIVGHNAGNDLDEGFQNTLIGNSAGDALTNARQNVGVGSAALGSLAGASQALESWNTAIGAASFNELTSGAYNVGLGYFSGQNITSGSHNIMIGYAASATVDGAYSDSAAIGSLAKIDGDHQFVFGTSIGGHYFSNFYLGRGKDQTTLDNTGVTIQASSISAGVTDSTYSYPLIIAGSQGTGADQDGNHIIFKTAPTGTTGSTQNALVDAMTIQQDGVVVFKAFTVATLPTAVAGGMIRVSDETGGDTLAYSDGTNWRRMSDGAIVS